jgi:septal ring factor EnvC (AmiA/AmiB activator)
MSAYKQGGEVPSAAAPAPTAGEGQQSEQHALEKDIRELKAGIEQLKTKIASDEAEIKTITNEVTSAAQTP